MMANKKIASVFYSLLIGMLYSPVTRRPLVYLVRGTALLIFKSYLKKGFSGKIKRIEYEKRLIIISFIESLKRAAQKKSMSKKVLNATIRLWANALAGRRDSKGEVAKFYEKNQTGPPFFLVISPGQACNLSCRGCYADSGGKNARLSWKVLDTLIGQAIRKWGIRLVVFSGGEPFAYRSEGKDILDIASKYRDCLFLAFTNGSLIDRATAYRLSECENITLAFSVEGMRQDTDRRRGDGTFEKILGSMAYLREAGSPFGISVMVDRTNHLKVAGEDFTRFFFEEMGSFYCFYFQYLPIGRNVDFDMMLSPHERDSFRKHVWEVMEKKKLFLIDFWNHGTIVNGCLAAGRQGGYLYIDWDGNIMPCVFTPYSAGNINDIFKQGNDIDSLYDLGFLRSFRRFQERYTEGGKKDMANLLRPCPYRDHYDEFLKMLSTQDCKHLSDLVSEKDYTQRMSAYGKKLSRVLDPVWEKEYL
jgi:MoaA/NifB/PqqE/SkfB family radical SAM enzyme